MAVIKEIQSQIDELESQKAQLEQPEEPTQTPEEEQEELIRTQKDAIEVIVRTPDQMGTHIYSTLQSETLGKKVVTEYKYQEIKDPATGAVRGRAMQGNEKTIMDYGVKVSKVSPTIISSKFV